MHGTAMLHIDTICIWGDSDDTTLAQITHWARHATELGPGRTHGSAWVSLAPLPTLGSPPVNCRH